MLGLYGLLRRQELIQVKWEDVKFTPEGISVAIYRQNKRELNQKWTT